MLRTRSIAGCGLSADLRARPWSYPGPVLPFACVQSGAELTPVDSGPELFGALRRAGLDPGGRHFVLGIGSNANPDVLRRKFERGGVPATMGHVPGSVAGLGLGHSAHVSVAGYVPATAFPDPGSTARAVLSVLTAEQLACLDATEPNYDRITVAGGAVGLPFALELPAEVHVYASRWGVLTGADGAPLPFGTQQAVFGRLAEWGLLPGGAATDLARLLGARPELRERVRDGLAGRSRRFG